MSKAILALSNLNSPALSKLQEYKIDDFENLNYYTQTKDLMELLRDVGAVALNPDTQLFEFNNFLSKNSKVSFVPRLLGYVAEGIIVRECNEYPEKNRRWVNIARYLIRDKNPIMDFIKTIAYEPLLASPTNYIAVGTGFALTLKKYPKFYCFNGDRDICWIDKIENIKDLLTVNGIYSNQCSNAGIQVKVSTGGGSGVLNFFRKKPCWKLYPVVYFDLGNDFYIVRDKLMSLDASQVAANSLFSSEVKYKNQTREDILDIMLIRGKDIDPALHEELLYYRTVFKKIEKGEINLFSLSDEKVILGLVTEYLGTKTEFSGSILTLPY